MNKSSIAKKSQTKQPKSFSVVFPKFCFWAVISITLVLLAWILFLRINDGFCFSAPKDLLIIFILLCLIIALITYNRKHPIMLFQSPKFWRILLIFSVVLGVAMRLLFLAFADEFNPNGLTSDTGVHFNAAQEIIASGEITSPEIGIYEAYHAQLTSYTLVTTLMQRIFGANYFSVLIPNLIFDLIAALALYVLFKKWQNQRVAIIGVAFYLLNPLGIAFCAQALALSIVSMFMAISLLVLYDFYQALQKGNYKKALILVVVCGIMLTLGNSLRPVFSIFVIAIAILLITHIINRPQKQNILYSLGSLALVIATFVLSGTLIDHSYQLVNPYYQDVGHGALGWNLFVGANYDSKGRWSFEDWELMPPRLFGGEMTPTEINTDFTNLAIQRYKDMGVRKLIVHLINKSSMLFARNEVTPIRNLEEQFTTVNGSEQWYWTLNNSVLLTLTVFAGLSFLYFWRIINNYKRGAKLDYFIFLLALCFCGLFASSLMVEVMSRYVSIFVVLLVIFSASAFYKPASNTSAKSES